MTPPDCPAARLASATPLHLPAALTAALLALAGLLCAQNASSPPPEEAIALNPFEVTADSDTSYGALSSRSITAFNTQLDHLPVSADIFDQTFMTDVGATTLEGLLPYSAGAGFVGYTGNVSTQGQLTDGRNQTYPQLRGMMTPNLQRDSLLFMGTPGSPGGVAPGVTSNFDLDRVEIIFGPQALLYDGGGAGGVINVVTKQARFDEPAAASDLFKIDQYGSKYNLFDFSAGSSAFAVRVAAVNASNDTNRLDLGDTLTGYYTQLAGILGNTTIRLSLEQTVDDQVVSSYPTLNSAGDPNYKQFNGLPLSDLLATGQAGGILNGGLNWGNFASLRGDVDGRTTFQEFGVLEADSKWTDWLSTQLSTGVSNWIQSRDQYNGSVTFYSPGSTSNTLPGNWTMGISSNYSANAVKSVFHGKALRFSALLTNALFGGRAKSQSIVGSDFVGNKGDLTPQDYFLADSNWNVIVNPASSANLGRTILPPLSWTINNGVIGNPLFNIGSPRITYQGQNYVLQQANPRVAALISPSNPEGAENAAGIQVQRIVDTNAGVYATNYTQWLDDKLDTMFGVRLEHQYTYTANGGSGAGIPMEITENHSFNFNVGTDYHVLSWLAPYVSMSNSYLVPPSEGVDPSGKAFPTSECLGEEAGVKINSASGAVSGSISYYHNQATNEEFAMTAVLLEDISPTGLNGRPATGTGYIANSESDGIQVTVTANPVPNWRIRLSASVADGRIQTPVKYGQLYNDQFYENSQGQVTYADGSVVYVAPTFNSKTPAYTASNAPAGAVPLTVASLSTPSNLYYANPTLVNGQINGGSDAAKVLTYIDPTHGPILTGASGLPISALQINPALTPGLTIPGSIPVAFAGQRTNGYPEFAVNLTSVYQFAHGPLRGVEAGGTLSLAWKNAAYYYYPQGLGNGTAGFSPTQFYLPTVARLDPIVGYSRKFRRVTFTSTLNIYNVFNHYRVLLFPDPILGWTSPTAIVANFSQQPREYTWTNSVKF